jgi:hypothetical protein
MQENANGLQQKGHDNTGWHACRLETLLIRIEIHHTTSLQWNTATGVTSMRCAAATRSHFSVLLYGDRHLHQRNPTECGNRSNISQVVWILCTLRVHQLIIEFRNTFSRWRVWRWLSSGMLHPHHQGGSKLLWNAGQYLTRLHGATSRKTASSGFNWLRIWYNCGLL